MSDAHAAEMWIAPLHLDDGRDEFRGRTFRTGFAATRRGGKEQPVLPIHQRLVELQQRCRLDERAKLRNAARAHEQRGQSGDEAIERGQIRRALLGAITDQDLMLEQQRFCHDGAQATGAQEVSPR